ncbi:MAG: Rieske 2Fe-2S domain-containing protein [Bacteroidetes bacterium]|nr:Rieske 2Fe-2S domain-containing protein [Bacteroidota bacterium]
MFKKYTWYKIAEHVNEFEFAKNNIAVIEFENKKICIAQHKDSLFAFAFRCPHAGAPLCNGFIDAMNNVVCPFHGYRYDIKNGRNTSGEGYYLKTWPIETRGDGIFIGIEEKGGLFGLFK